MNVWLSTIGQRLDHADNTRTMLLAEHLMKAGHEVTLWTSAYDHIRKVWREEWVGSSGAPVRLESGLLVRFMKGCGYSTNVSVRRLVDHILVARDFRRQAESLPAPDIAVASLPDHITAAAMVDFAQAKGFPAIIDVRDKWPDIFIDYAPPHLKPAVRLCLATESARARKALRRADSLVAMMNSMLDWGLSKAGRTKVACDKVFFLATTPKSTEASTSMEAMPPNSRAIFERTEGTIRFVFVGTFNRTQHPMLALEAFERLAARADFPSDKVSLLIGGDGIEADAVRVKIESLPNAHHLGWLKPSEMQAILTRCDIGLLPLNFSSPAFNNKAFAYLGCGLPILNCALGDLTELIEDCGIGINVAAGKPDAMADAIAELVANPARIEVMKANVDETFDALFDQLKIYSSYVAHIESIAKAGGRTV